MRSTLRSLTFGLAATCMAGSSWAQQEYLWVIDGTVVGCTPGQVVNFTVMDGNTQNVLLTQTVTTQSDCSFGTALNVPAPWVLLTTTTQCNGMSLAMNDSALFNFFMDTVFTSITFDCGGGQPVDCNGVVNGPDMPGTPCEDGSPMTSREVWSPDCECVGTSMNDCQAIFTVEQAQVNDIPVAWEINTTNLSTGAEPITYEWWLPDGNLSNAPEPSFTFTQAGTYGICLTITADNGACTSVLCDTIVVDDQGFISTDPVWYDCLGVLWGTDLPGMPCTDFLGNLGVWNSNCVCVSDSMNLDCMGTPGGGAQPGTPCVFTPDSGNTFIPGTWSVNCECVPDSGEFYLDCLGVMNGPAVAGTPCIIPGSMLEGVWDENCVCVADNPFPCEADFWVIQAMGPDSLPIPYELWVWNLSSGGSGNFAFTWDFGDGTSSTDAFPTHTYSGSGPYNLCLTILDNNGCTDTYCDSVSINGDGIYEGMVVHAEDRQDGFTINVQDPQANSVQDLVADNSIALWPNPVTDELNVAVVSGMKGAVTVTITDLEGRTVLNERANLTGDRSQLRLATSSLKAGMYLLRISDGGTNLSQRFVRTH